MALNKGGGAFICGAVGGCEDIGCFGCSGESRDNKFKLVFSSSAPPRSPCSRLELVVALFPSRADAANFWSFEGDNRLGGAKAEQGARVGHSIWVHLIGGSLLFPRSRRRLPSLLPLPTHIRTAGGPRIRSMRVEGREGESCQRRCVRSRHRRKGHHADRRPGRRRRGWMSSSAVAHDRLMVLPQK